MGGFKAPAQYVKAPPGLELAPDPEPPLTFFNAWKCKKRALLSVQNFKAHRNCPHPSSLRKRLRSEVANGPRLDAQMEKLHPPLGRRRDVGDLPPMRGSERLLKIYNISAFPPCAPIYIYILWKSTHIGHYKQLYLCEPSMENVETGGKRPVIVPAAL